VPQLPENQHFAAALRGPNHVVEDIGPCFNTALVTIRRRREVEWIMESSNFERCESSEEAYEVAKELLSRIHQLIALYVALYTRPLSITAILTLNDADNVVKRRIYATFMQLHVYKGAKRTFIPSPSGSLGTAVLSQAATDPAVAEALSLFGDEPPTWARVYDIIEFLGGERSIHEADLASWRDIRKMRQTANHYRHLGSRKKYPLPTNPPTLGEACALASDLLTKWIAKRI
jgi:hypothetical protein